ncbi:hypothetical protein RchiOBHm_Chr6g0250531 [Rosa chinensis]|uniref:Uncharacterized protein n=1 Tax=Rosa chinensis TaxID=74649 RepID=A0A2P6PKJ8_ROSCH|nr:hypothetical protein RchiOBHm_Chr6g0250531 [Rosa chinensis]
MNSHSQIAQKLIILGNQNFFPTQGCARITMFMCFSMWMWVIMTNR